MPKKPPQPKPVTKFADPKFIAGLLMPYIDHRGLNLSREISIYSRIDTRHRTRVELVIHDWSDFSKKFRRTCEHPYDALRFLDSPAGRKLLAGKGRK